MNRPADLSPGHNKINNFVHSLLRRIRYTTQFDCKEENACQTPHSADQNSKSNCAPDSLRWACFSTHIVRQWPSNWRTPDTTGCWLTRSTATWVTTVSQRCSAESQM